MKKTILITGATGYIGGCLMSHLSTKEYHVKALARFPDNLLSRLPSKNITVIQGDVLDESSLQKALVGVDVAFYLVHSMGAKEGFEELDRIGAENFARACDRCQVKKIIYLGGLGSSRDQPLSNHMRSRHEVGNILRKSKSRVIEFRSSIILGSGSLSYEMMKALVEKLPIMVAPKWINYLVQPIYIEDVISYLLEGMEKEFSENKIIEIGGATVLSYKDFMHAYAKEKGLKRVIITVPILTPGLSSLWLSLVTPVYKTIGKKLIESIVNDSVVKEFSKPEKFNVHPLSCRDGIALCIEAERKKKGERVWYDAVSSKGLSKDLSKIKFKKTQTSCYMGFCNNEPKAVYSFIQTIGGQTPWYAQILWKIRGFIDYLCGGVGFKRQRRDLNHLKVGDPFDFWRVIEMKEDELILLKAEMKLPGVAYLCFRITPKDKGSIVEVESIFRPYNFFGIFYWYLFLPFHFFIFKGLIKTIQKGVSST